jgi:hypothetical protein
MDTLGLVGIRVLALRVGMPSLVAVAVRTSRRAGWRDAQPDGPIPEEWVLSVT